MLATICRYIACLLLQGDLRGVHIVSGWFIVCMQHYCWNLLLSFWVRIHHWFLLVCLVPNVSFANLFLLQAHSNEVWNGEYNGLHTPAIQCASSDDTNDANLEYSPAYPVYEVNCASLPFSLQCIRGITMTYCTYCPTLRPCFPVLVWISSTLFLLWWQAQAHHDNDVNDMQIQHLTDGCSP